MVAADGAPARRIDRFRILLFGPPENLIQPVDPPITERAIGIIEEVAKALGVHLGIERSQRRRPTPEIPIQPSGNLGIRDHSASPSTVMHEGTHHSDLAGLTFFQELHARDIMWRYASMRPDLHHSIGITCRLDHRGAFENGVTDRFLDIHMRSDFACLDHGQRVPVIGRRYNHDFRFLFLQQLPIVFVLLRRAAGHFLDFLGGRIDLVAINVTQPHHVDCARLNGRGQDVHAPPPRTNQRGAIFLLRVRPQQNWRG